MAEKILHVIDRVNFICGTICPENMAESFEELDNISQQFSEDDQMDIVIRAILTAEI